MIHEARQTVQLTNRVGEQPSLQPPPKWHVPSYTERINHLVSVFELVTASH